MKSEIFLLFFSFFILRQASVSRACFCTNLSLSSLISTQTEKEELLEEARKAGYLVTKLQQNLNSRDTDIQKLGAGGWPGRISLSLRCMRDCSSPPTPYPRASEPWVGG